MTPEPIRYLHNDRPTLVPDVYRPPTLIVLFIVAMVLAILVGVMP